MDSDENPNPFSVFLFDLLPTDIKERILALLHIPTLVICKAVSPSWRAIIRSPAFIASYRRRRDDVIFLLFKDFMSTSGSAYLPSDDRWIPFRVPKLVTAGVRTSGPSSVAKSLILTDIHVHWYAVINPFSCNAPVRLPRVLNSDHWHVAIALIEESPSDYQVVVIAPQANISTTQIYDSRCGQWVPRGQIPIDVHSLMNAVWHDGLLFCLHISPDRFITFDVDSGKWSILDLKMPMPSLFCCDILAFGGKIYLMGGIGGDAALSRIGIWELDGSAMKWREFEFMPVEYFNEFYGGQGGFSVVACQGMICFCTFMNQKILMCDLAVRRWWWPKPCNNHIDEGLRMSLEFALEPHTDLLK